MEDDIKEMFCL